MNMIEKLSNARWSSRSDARTSLNRNWNKIIKTLFILKDNKLKNQLRDHLIFR